jgi:hypothetical protein
MAATWALVRRHRINKGELKRMNIKILVDSNVLMLCINELIQDQLQLTVVEKKQAQFANGLIVECDVVAPVEVRFKNRQTTCRAMVLPNDREPILGAIPLTDMNVLIQPVLQKLIVNPDHPDLALVKV